MKLKTDPEDINVWVDVLDVLAEHFEEPYEALRAAARAQYVVDEPFREPWAEFCL